jgi:hypothetical protein
LSSSEQLQELSDSKRRLPDFGMEQARLNYACRQANNVSVRHFYQPMAALTPALDSTGADKCPDSTILPELRGVLALSPRSDVMANSPLSCLYRWGVPSLE